jgi:hypothetical protein
VHARATDTDFKVARPKFGVPQQGKRSMPTNVFLELLADM